MLPKPYLSINIRMKDNEANKYLSDGKTFNIYCVFLSIKIDLTDVYNIFLSVFFYNTTAYS